MIVYSDIITPQVWFDSSKNFPIAGFWIVCSRWEKNFLPYLKRKNIG